VPTVARILLVSGSTRSASTNTAALRAVQALMPEGVVGELYEGLPDLPAFNPDDDYEPLHPVVARLRQAIARSDAVLFCTPEYAGALPGAFKNLLEWTVGDAGTYDKRVAWINAAGPAAPTGAADAHDSLRKVLTYAGAKIVEEACARIPVSRADVADGQVADGHLLDARRDVAARRLRR
jgi:NAD(P)H-dependent FMN reductase